MYPGRDRRFSSAATKLCWNASWNVWMLRAGWRKYIGSRPVAGLDFVGRPTAGSRRSGAGASRRLISPRRRLGSRGQRNTSCKQARLTCRKEVTLTRGKYRPRHGSYAEAEVTELWVRRAAGETGTRIARHMGLDATALRDYFHKAGGIRPRPRKRSRIALSLADREEISRGLAAAESLRSIAARIARSPSTVSREVARNQGRRSYRAGLADQQALNRGRRPK